MTRPFLPAVSSDGACEGVTILVIDDSATIRSAAEKVLREAGYRVVVAENGFEALAKIADCQPALIVCDIVMPRLDGYRNSKRGCVLFAAGFMMKRPACPTKTSLPARVGPMCR